MHLKKKKKKISTDKDIQKLSPNNVQVGNLKAHNKVNYWYSLHLVLVPVQQTIKVCAQV